MKTPRERPFPRRCAECAKAAVQPATIAYNAEVKHGGRLHRFFVPQLRVNKCECGEVIFTNATDEQIERALHEHLGEEA